MATLTGDLRVWSLREDVVVRDADLSAVRYQDKSNVSKERVYYDQKKSYIEARGGCVVPKNSRPARLRDAIKEFEELVSSERVVWSSWQAQQQALPGAEEEPCRLYQMMLSSGVVCSALVSAVTGDLKQLSSDKYLTGKLLSEQPAHAVITSSHLLISYNDSRLSVLHVDPYTAPASLPAASPSAASTEAAGWSAIPPAIVNRHPTLHTVQLAGPHGRRFQRRLSANVTGSMVLVWWERTEDEVYPWSPVERDRRDRANILVYTLHSGQMSLLCHARSHLPPLSVAFSTRDANVVLSVEQGFDKKGGVNVLSVVYKISDSSMERVSVTSIPLEAPVASHSYSPREDRLVLACNNGVLALHSHSSTHLTRAALSPTHVTWLQPGALVVMANDRGQLQCFDMALSLVRVQLGGEDGLPVRLLDLADYFCHQPSLYSVSWAPAPVVFSGGTAASGSSSGADYDHSYLDLMEQYSSMLLLLHYSRGPLTCLRFNAPHFSLTYPIINFKTDDLNTSTDSKPDATDLHNISQTSFNTTASASSTSSNAKSSPLNSKNGSSSSLSKINNKTASTKRARTSHFCSISPDVLIGEYLCHGQVEEATNLCGSLCWEQDGGVALKCVSCVVNYIIRRGNLVTNKNTGTTESSATSDNMQELPLASGDDVVTRNSGDGETEGPASHVTRDGGNIIDSNEISGGNETNSGICSRPGVGLWENRILGAAAVLSSGFLSPNTPLTSATEDLYGPAVRALARRLFFKLLRCECLQSAYVLACDLGDPDCFMRLNRSAERLGLSQLASDSLDRADSLRSNSSLSSSSCCSGSCSGHSTGSSSGSSGSCCSESCTHDHGSDCSSSYTGSSGSYSETCSTCSETGSGSGDSDTEEEDKKLQRGERQKGDGIESEGNSSVRYSLSAAPDDQKQRLQHPLYVQQSTQEPAPAPAPVLPASIPPLAQDAPSNTLTYYDPVSRTLKYDNNKYSTSNQTSNEYEPALLANQAGNKQTINSANTTGAYLSYSDPTEHISSAEQFVATQYPDSRNAMKTVDEGAPYSSNALLSSLPFTFNTPVAPFNSESIDTTVPRFTSESPVAAITSQDGKVTINITSQSNTNRKSHHRSSHRSHHRLNNKIQHTSFKDPAVPDVVTVPLNRNDVPLRTSSHDRQSDNHSNKKSLSTVPFANRKSVRNHFDAMDAADSAIAAVKSNKLNATPQTSCTPLPSNHCENNSSLTNDSKQQSTFKLVNTSLDAPQRISHSSRYRASKQQEGAAGVDVQSCVSVIEHPVSSTILNHASADNWPASAYYNEDTIDEELNRSIYQELSTEEEEGGTVKVVHFGVV